MPPTPADILSLALPASPPRPPLTITEVRYLREGELDETPKGASAGAGLLRKLGTAHHRLAQLLAQGRSPYDVSLITGYSTGHISTLQRDPLFIELKSHYGTVEEIAVSDVRSQMQALGLDTLAVLRERLEESSDVFTIQQLHEQTKLLLIEPMKADASLRAPPAGPAPPPITISFVSAPAPLPSGEDMRVIEGERVR